MSELPRLRAGDPERDHALRVLAEAHSAGRIDVGELAERQDRVLSSRFTDELDALVEDLPEANRLPAVPAVKHRGALQVPAGPDVGVSAVMSGKDLCPPPGTRRLHGLQWWGGHTIDLSDCLGPGITVELELVAVMGGSTIRVPPGVRVEDRTFNIMAGNSVSRRARGDGSNGTVVLKGFSWWGGHNVKRTEPD
ncbi:DUF1707 domain-containing protein [Luteococcus peritonei]|uniref:DUF1707 domain-containing protein n=1 Tax=Luteococcus peritonei TaxID=88874 RepID=A0ABW4S0G6_9ACTN